MAEAGAKRTLAPWVWVLVAGLAVFELVAQPRIREAIPSEESWSEAAAFVRAEREPSDRIVSAPSWIDPIVRRELGDLASLRAAAPPDEAGFTRVWEVGIRGATTRRDAPALERHFGLVRVRMWPVNAPTIVYDFVEEIATARVELDTEEGPLDCPWTRARPDPGGLERGPMRPAERFACDPKRPWLWVAATVLADLELEPRRCIWQHPAGPKALTAIFEDVPLGDRLVVHGGVDYQVARRRSHAPVTLRVKLDGDIAAELVHRDGDGWSGLAIDTSAREGERVEVRFETTTPDPAARLFCYAASTEVSSDD